MEALSDVLGRAPNELWVTAIEGDGDSILVLCDQGLVRFSDGQAVIQILDDWPVRRDTFRDLPLWTKMLRRKSGEVLVTAPVTHSKSRLWRRPAGGKKFERVRPDYPLITALAEVPGPTDGTVLVGTRDGKVLTLDGDRVTPRWDVAKFAKNGKPELASDPVLIRPISGVAFLGDSQLLVRDNHATLVVVDVGKEEGRNMTTLEGSLSAWTQSAALPGNRALLLHADGSVSLVAAQEGRVDRASLDTGGDPIKALTQYPPARAQRDNVEDRVWLVGARNMWSFHPGAGSAPRAQPLRAKSVRPLPVELQGGQLVGVADGHGVWLGTRGHGLWYVPADGPVRRWRDGLPSPTIDAITLGPDRLPVVFTTGGHCRVSREGPVQKAPLSGILGAPVRSALLVDLTGGTRVLILGTAKGLSIARLDGEDKPDWAKVPWTHKDRNDGLPNDTVRALCWFAGKNELWVGTGDGVAVFNLDLPTGDKRQPVSLALDRSITESFGRGALPLPAGRVAGISLAPDGENAWLLVNNRVCRWNRSAPARNADPSGPRVVARSEPFLFASAAELHLGPAVAGRTPQVLVAHGDGGCSVWNPSGYLRPRLKVENWGFWLHRQLANESLDPDTEGLAAWGHPRFGKGRYAGGTSWARCLPTDLWGDREQHIMWASVDDGNGTRHVVTDLAPEPLALPLIVLRLAVAFLVPPTVLGLTVRWVSRLRRRAARLRVRENPYVMGDPIEDPEKFFGRRERLQELLNTLESTSYALIGELRIGKTSIQRQLTLLLRGMSKAEVKFIPVWADMQELRDARQRDAQFFYFLGGKLVGVAKQGSVPEAVLRTLEWKDSIPPISYRHDHFHRDLGSLVRHWEGAGSTRPIVVLQIDEITFFDDLECSTLSAFRWLFMENPTHLKTVLTGPKIRKDCDKPGQSEWWNFLQTRTVEPMTPAEMRELIVRPARGLFAFDEGCVQRIMAHSLGKPLHLQTICSGLLQYKYRQARLTRRISEKDLNGWLEEQGPTTKGRSKATSQFSPGTPVKGDSFYGRDRELQAIREQQHTWVCGQRRIGKTSLLHKAAAEAKEQGWRPLLWSLETLPEPLSGEELLSGLLERHGSTDLAPLGIDVAGLVGGPRRPVPRPDRRDDKARREGLFLWDEAERLLDVAANDPAFIAGISDCFRSERVRWVLAASQLLAVMLRPDDDSFLTAFRWQTLAGLDDCDASALLRCKLGRGWESPLSEHVVRRAVSWTGGHPYVLQALGQALEQTTEGNGRLVNNEVLRQCQEMLVKDQAVQAIFRSDFERLTSPQQQLLRELCRSEPPLTLPRLAADLSTSAEEVAESLNFLKSYGYVSWGDQVRLRFGFYRDFLIPAPAPQSSNATVVGQIPRRLFRSNREAELVGRLSKDGPKRILSLDGGGIRGALTLGFLARIESILRDQHNNQTLRLCDYFDLIGGTSTGAIIATALALGKEVKEVRELYQQLGGHIFSKKMPWWKRIFAAFPEDLAPFVGRAFRQPSVRERRRPDWAMCLRQAG